MLVSACMLRLYHGGRSRGQTPRTPNIFYKAKLNINEETRVSILLDNEQPIRMCQRTTNQCAPRHPSSMSAKGTALHVAIQTVRTGTVNTQI